MRIFTKYPIQFRLTAGMASFVQKGALAYGGEGFHGGGIAEFQPKTAIISISRSFPFGKTSGKD